MIIVNITDECYHLIAANSVGGSTRRGGVQQADGTWDVLLAPDTLHNLLKISFDDETLSDTIIRAINKANGSIQ